MESAVVHAVHIHPLSSYPLKESVDAGAGLGERRRPAFERGASGLGQLVGALGRPGQRFVPLAGHEALLFERAQDAVEVADVNALLADHGREPLE